MTQDVCPMIEAPRRSFSISVNAYECLPGLVFVKVPNERGRWILTHRCVAEVDCPQCKAVAGEPCRRGLSGGHIRYWVDTHCARRYAANRWSREPKPKVRLSLSDIEAANSEAPAEESP